MVSPLYFLTWKDVPFDWIPTCEQAFDELKQALITAPVLAYPNFEQVPVGDWCLRNQFGSSAGATSGRWYSETDLLCQPDIAASWKELPDHGAGGTWSLLSSEALLTLPLWPSLCGVYRPWGSKIPSEHTTIIREAWPLGTVLAGDGFGNKISPWKRKLQCWRSIKEPCGWCEFGLATSISSDCCFADRGSCKGQGGRDKCDSCWFIIGSRTTQGCRTIRLDLLPGDRYSSPRL